MTSYVSMRSREAADVFNSKARQAGWSTCLWQHPNGGVLYLHVCKGLYVLVLEVDSL
jgi:hypothetical protein